MWSNINYLLFHLTYDYLEKYKIKNVKIVNIFFIISLFPVQLNQQQEKVRTVLFWCKQPVQFPKVMSNL